MGGLGGPCCPPRGDTGSGSPGRGQAALLLTGGPAGPGRPSLPRAPWGKTAVGVTGGTTEGWGTPSRRQPPVTGVPPGCRRGRRRRRTHRSAGGARTSSLSGQPTGTLGGTRRRVGLCGAQPEAGGWATPPPHHTPCLSFPFSQPKDSPWGRGSHSRRGSRIHPEGKGRDGEPRCAAPTPRGRSPSQP